MKARKARKVKAPRPQATKWKDEYYIKIHELAKSGLGNFQIAKAIGVVYKTFEKWVLKRPALRVALDNARKYGKQKSETQTFIDYVYEQLPEHLRELWDDIEQLSKEKNGMKKIEFLLEDHGTRARQHLFMHALVCCNFNISKACSKVNISRITFDKWVRTDPDFHDLVDEMQFHKKNFFEAALVGLVYAGDPAATIFANKTLNKDRGYGEKIEVSGSVDHKHTVTVDSLNLPIEVRQQVLDAIRTKRVLDVEPENKRISHIPTELEKMEEAND